MLKHKNTTKDREDGVSKGHHRIQRLKPPPSATTTRGNFVCFSAMNLESVDLVMDHLAGTGRPVPRVASCCVGVRNCDSARVR